MCVSLDVNINESLTNDIVSFEQLGPVVAKRMISAKKVLYAILFSGEGVAIQVPEKRGKKVTGK